MIFFISLLEIFFTIYLYWYPGFTVSAASAATRLTSICPFATFVVTAFDSFFASPYCASILLVIIFCSAVPVFIFTIYVLEISSPGCKVIPSYFTSFLSSTSLNCWSLLSPSISVEGVTSSVYIVPSGTRPTNVKFSTFSEPVFLAVNLYCIFSPSFTVSVSFPPTVAFKLVSTVGPFPVVSVILLTCIFCSTPVVSV